MIYKLNQWAIQVWPGSVNAETNGAGVAMSRSICKPAKLRYVWWPWFTTGGTCLSAWPYQTNTMKPLPAGLFYSVAKDDSRKADDNEEWSLPRPKVIPPQYNAPMRRYTTSLPGWKRLRLSWLRPNAGNWLWRSLWQYLWQKIHLNYAEFLYLARLPEDFRLKHVSFWIIN